MVSDAVWAKIASLLPGKATDPGATGKDNRLFLEAVLWRVRTGSPWRDLPSGFGHWNSVFQRFRRWVRAGVFERLFEWVPDEPDLEYGICQEFCVWDRVDQVMAKRSSKRMANCALAAVHSRAGILHCLAARFKTRNSSFSTASSVGKWPRARTARRSFACSASMALVTGMRIAVPVSSGWGGVGVPAYGATVRGGGHREHAEWAGRCVR